MNFEISKERCLHLAELGEDITIGAGLLEEVNSEELQYLDEERENQFKSGN